MPAQASLFSTIDIVTVSDNFLYFTGPDAAGTDFYGLDRAVLHGTDLLQVRAPHGTGFVVGVTDIISGNGFFPADFTLLGHLYNPPESFERALLAYFFSGCKFFQGFSAGK